MSRVFVATGAWWRKSFVPWAYNLGRVLARYWPELAGALLGGVLCALIGCGRGGACPPPKHGAQSSSGQQSSQPCEVRK